MGPSPAAHHPVAVWGFGTTDGAGPSVLDLTNLAPSEGFISLDGFAGGAYDIYQITVAGVKVATVSVDSDMTVI